MKLTRARLKELLDYNQETGFFAWRVAFKNGVQAGAIAGTTTRLFYVSIGIDGGLHLAHRLAWLYVYGRFPKDEIDHINHIRNDNRISNLRETTKKENQRNRAISPRNTSGVTGVCVHKRDGGWRAQIRMNWRTFNLGRYDNIFDAICARKSAELKYGFHENHGI